MKVKIVDKKEDVKEMMIEELVKQKFIGLDTGGHKYLSVPVWGGWELVRPEYYFGSGKHSKIDKLKQVYNSSFSFHVFDTARELYLWMAK